MSHRRWSLALCATALTSLGATECSQQDLFEWAARTLAQHEERITRLEHCQCDGVLAPVCGEDGGTYVSPCRARCAGVPIAGPGPCDPPECGGLGGRPCEGSELCETPAGCDPLAPGMCVEPPTVCTDEYDPVCGCDGQTYGNDCERRAAGVTLEYPGACESGPIACDSNEGCAIDEYCARRKGKCDVGEGVCLPRPMACTREFAPVCGCDGETWSNRCVAASQGTSVAYEGECRPQPSVCRDDADCREGAYCRKREGLCEAEGRCAPRPEVCPFYLDPVCGCDGETYDNACKAAGAGVSLAADEGCVSDLAIVCHIPPGNPAQRHTLRVGIAAIPAHLGHGDHRGPCDD